MRVLIVSASYYPVLGGLQTVVHQLALGLMHQGHEVRVVTNRYPRQLSRREIFQGVSITRLLFLKPGLDLLKRRRPDLFLASLFLYPFTLN